MLKQTHKSIVHLLIYNFKLFINDEKKLSLLISILCGLLFQQCSNDSDMGGKTSSQKELSSQEKDHYEASLKNDVNELIAKPVKLKSSFYQTQGLPLWQNAKWVKINSNPTNKEWSPTRNCAGYAAEAWGSVTGDKIDGGLLITPDDVENWINSKNNNN